MFLSLLVACSLALGTFAGSSCPHDPSGGLWSTVDCQKIQLPYHGNPIIPPNPGPYSPPKPLPAAPTKSNPSLTKQYFNSISSILKGSENTKQGSHTTCEQCTSTFGTLHEAAHKISPSDITTLLSQLCAAGFQLFSSEHCTGPESLYGGSASEGPYMAKLFYLLEESTQDVNALCVFKHNVACPAPPVVQIRESDWFKSVKPPAKDVKQTSNDTFGVVHMSDIHLDPRYEIGPQQPRWGVYGEDSPADLMLSAFSTMRSLVDMDKVGFTIFTGDIVNHGSDDSLSETYVQFEEESVFQSFKAEMTDTKGGIPVYAALGNHDSYPEMYANSDSSWNYNFLSSLWQKNHWIDAPAAQDVRTHFGAYAVSNPPGMPGLKVISINTDFWYVDNIFNFANYSNPDPNGMLSFLIAELEASEASSQRVWIVGHVPSGYDSGSALPNPTALFQSIVVRFSPSTIAGIFWGHTHDDQKIVYYDFANNSLANGLRDTSKLDLTKPLNVGWIGPSITPSASPDNVNPAWSYYEVDKLTYSILNAQTYYSDISKINKQWAVAPFKLEYDVRKAYDSKASWPANRALDGHFWDRYLAQAIGNDSAVATVYNRLEVRDSPSSRLCNTLSCQQSKKCKIQAGTAQAASKCGS